MARGREIFVGTVQTKPGDRIPIAHLLETRAINGGIIGIQAALDRADLTPENLAYLANLAFSTQISPEQVYVDIRPIDKRDRFFADQFGFTILPLGYAGLKEGKIEAWIQPTLVPKDHSLTQTENGNAVMLTTGLGGVYPLSFNQVRPYDESWAAHYVRMTVKDHPGVLARITWGFADRKISIKGLLQPKAPEGVDETDIASILWPCQTGVLQSALDSIGASEDILRTHAVFRVLS